MHTNKSWISLIVFLIGSIWAGLCCSNTQYPEGLYAELHTNKGLIVLALEYEKTPMTVASFVGLVEGTIKNDVFPEGVPFFDGSKFHRVVPGHVIQAGAPDTEEEGRLGYMFPNEIHPELSHNRAGVLGMANGGPHTNGNQFYITLSDRSYLDGDYTVFGEVVEGMDVVNSIRQDDVIQNVKIVRSGKSARQFRADTEVFYNLVDQVEKRVEAQEKEKKARESATIQNQWPDAVESDSGLKYVIVKEGKGKVPELGSKVRIRYSGEVLNGKMFFSTTNGKPNNEPPAEEFIMEIGKNHVTTGFDQAVMEMRLGEKRILILPSPLAYGTSGFYAKEIQGKKRFVISPNSTLVYEVELLELIF
ncbi:MAG: peptidylprolyl isomerase [Candidatus Aminicenantes bacterium]|nr:MAG: peptidylprolyl isomerase [Candidatus Aminicenantes bacterium]